LTLDFFRFIKMKENQGSNSKKQTKTYSREFNPEYSKEFPLKFKYNQADVHSFGTVCSTDNEISLVQSVRDDVGLVTSKWWQTSDSSGRHNVTIDKLFAGKMTLMSFWRNHFWLWNRRTQSACWLRGSFRAVVAMHVSRLSDLIATKSVA